MPHCTKCGNKIEEGEEYCSECGQPVKRKEGITKEEKGPTTVQGLEASKGQQNKFVKRKLSTLWGILTVFSIMSIISMFLPWLSALITASSTPELVGMVIDYSAWNLATGSVSVFGFTVSFTAEPIYWMPIVGAILTLVISLSAIMTLYTSQKPPLKAIGTVQLIGAILLTVGLAILYQIDLRLRLGEINTSGTTAIRSLGLGFYLNLISLIIMTILSATVLRYTANEKPEQE